MQHNTAENINLASLTFWSNNWGVLYKGYQEFNGLPVNFAPINGILKKAENLNIYAILLPIPNEFEYSVYHQDKQEFKFFEIEHYFELDYLKSKNMVTETAIPGVFEITGNKSEFKDDVLKNIKKETYKNFIDLFTEIDKITGQIKNYIE